MALFRISQQGSMAFIRSRATAFPRIIRCSAIPRVSSKLISPSLISRIASRQTSTTVGPGKKTLFPERLIIYHAGTGRTTFLACLKLTTIFVFCFFTIVVTPAYISANDPLKAAGVAICGTIPLLIVAYTTSPFVAWVHLRLPPYARNSREVLQRFAKTMPPNTRLQVTTMNLIGKPRVSEMTVSDLRPANQRFGVVNYVRDTALANASRPWWMFRAVGRFNIQRETSDTTKEGWVWKEIADGIARRQEQQQQAK